MKHQEDTAPAIAKLTSQWKRQTRHECARNSVRWQRGSEKQSRAEERVAGNVGCYVSRVVWGTCEEGRSHAAT